MMQDKYRLGRVHDPETPRAAALHPVRAATSDLTAKKWPQDGAWLDQGPYGTCVGNAFAHRRADGPVPILNITETWARKLYLDASGDTTYQQGTSGYAACRVLLSRGAISAFDWVLTPEDLRYTILELGSVCVGIPWYNSMFTPKTVDSQRYIEVDPSSGLAGGYEFVVNGIDLAPWDNLPPYYRMKNSWGRGWSKNGTARFRLEDLENLIFGSWGDAVLIHELPRKT